MPKQNYLCLQRSQPTSSSANHRAPTPAQMEQMYAEFNAWRQKFQDNIVDMGGRLTGAGKIVTTEGGIDGPSAEKELIGGYMILSAETLEEAAEIARLCPGVIRPGSSIEVREISAP